MGELFVEWCRRRDSNSQQLSPLPPQDSVSTNFHHDGFLSLNFSEAGLPSQTDSNLLRKTSSIPPKITLKVFICFPPGTTGWLNQIRNGGQSGTMAAPPQEQRAGLQHTSRLAGHFRNRPGQREKNKVAMAAVARDKSWALPLAPNRSFERCCQTRHPYRHLTLEGSRSSCPGPQDLDGQTSSSRLHSWLVAPRLNMYRLPLYWSALRDGAKSLRL